jgi:hypothetical protein
MKMSSARTVFVGVMFAACSSAALAQYAEKTAKDKSPLPAAPEWTESDTNRDGYLTKEELIPFPGVLKHFEEIDTDRDGRISKDEYQAWRDNKHDH